MILESLGSASTAIRCIPELIPVVDYGGVFYLDPGTGSLVIQMAIGAVAGGLVGTKLLWRRIGGWFGHLTGKTVRVDRTQN